jgi:hypothetical protein
MPSKQSKIVGLINPGVDIKTAVLGKMVIMDFLKKKQVFPCVAVTAWSSPATYGTEGGPDPRRGTREKP